MYRKIIAEWLCTYILMFIGTGGIIVNELTGSLTDFGVAAVFGLIVMVLIYTFAHISGAHMNPAVTIGFYVNKDISLTLALSYIAAQISAAITASFSLFLIFGNVADLGATIPSVSWQQTFAIEVIISFSLMMIIFGCAVHGKAIKTFAGFTVGSTVYVIALFAGPISGASMNPARSIGPAVVAGVYEGLWIYMTATVLGMAAAAFVYRLIRE